MRRLFLALNGFVVSAFGLYLAVDSYNTFVPTGRLTKHATTAPYAETAYEVLFTLASLIVITLGVTSIQLLTDTRKSPLPFCLAALAPLPLFFIVGASWLLPEYGRSIATVSGVAMMPVMPVLLSGIWLLAPALWMIIPDQRAAGGSADS